MSGKVTRTSLARFWEKIRVEDPADPNSCLLWTASLAGKGYAKFWDGGQTYGHIFSYKTFVGPIPPGHQVDHVRERGCRHLHCVNWDHLEAVTCRENLLRGTTITAANAARTKCPAGHSYSGANLYVVPSSGFRQCRTCRKAADSAYRLRRAA